MEQLLKILENNARLPVEDIATMLNKSSEVAVRMMDLARALGIIKGYKTLTGKGQGELRRRSSSWNVIPKRAAALTRSLPPSPPLTRWRACC